MADILVTSPFHPFTLPTQFKAVFNGYIYCGTVDAVDPSVSHVQVYLVNESGDKVPVSQPLRTNAGGYLVYNGQPAKFVTDSNHSLLVQDQNHVQVWYAPDMATADPETAIKIIGPQAAEALRRSYAEAGYIIVGTFQEGFTYGNANDVGIDEATGKGYVGPAGGVAPGTDPTLGGFTDVSGELLRSQLGNTVLMFGADKTGVLDSTAAFVAAGAGAFIPDGTYSIQDNLPDVYLAGANVTITGNGTVKMLTDEGGMATPPAKSSKHNGGLILSSVDSQFLANSGEFVRGPVFSAAKFNARTFIGYTVTVGTVQDPGQTPNQPSRVEIRYSGDGVSFTAPPTIISTEGEPYAAGPSMTFDHKRGRLWAVYFTGRGQIGVGHGGVGYDPNVTFQTWITYSDTYGAGWSTPINITEKVKPYDATSAWTPPSEICVAANGSLLVPYTWVKQGGAFYHGYIIVDELPTGELKYSRQLIVKGGRNGSNGGGELAIVQLGDGSFLSLVRDYYNDAGNTKGLQCLYRSFDGLTWNFQSSINTTNCYANLCVYSAMAFGDSRDVLMITAPIGGSEDLLHRSNLQMWVSTNSGVTWQNFNKPIFDDKFINTGYSSIAVLNSGAILVAAEGTSFGAINFRHKAVGAFTGESTFAKYWGALHVTDTSSAVAVCQLFDIPQQELFWDRQRHTLNINDGGVPLRLTDSLNGLDVTSATLTLNSNVASIFYVSVTTTFNQILGDAARVVIVSTQGANPVTLAENAGVPLTERIRVNKVVSAKAIVLHRTKFGWYPDAGVAG